MNKLTIIKQLNRETVENQAREDLIKYQKLTKKEANDIFPIQPDHLAETLYDYEVHYKTLTPQNDQTIIAYLEPASKSIVINELENSSDGRINFSTAHELGHLSLHSPFNLIALNKTEKNKLICYKNGVNNTLAGKMEAQANYYASELLLPKYEIIDNFNIDDTIDINRIKNGLMAKYGVSRQCLEIKFNDLGYKLINNKYQLNKIKSRALTRDFVDSYNFAV
jgi:Zn-dependent peptidase ImmA (M78 family)